MADLDQEKEKRERFLPNMRAFFQQTERVHFFFVCAQFQKVFLALEKFSLSLLSFVNESAASGRIGTFSIKIQLT